MGVKKFIKKSVAFVAVAAMTLSMAVVPARAVVAYAEGTNDNLQLSKSIELGSDGNYKITLEAYATGKDTTTTVTKSTPLDIVLVLDQSGSMDESFTTGSVSYNAMNSRSYSYSDFRNNTEYYYKDGENYYRVQRETYERRFLFWTTTYYCLYYQIGNTKYYLNGSGVTTTRPSNVDSNNGTIWTGVLYTKTAATTTTRLNALKSAVTNFVNTVENDATTNKVDHRIAMVGFASESGYSDNTEILSVSGTNSGSVGVKYNSNSNNTAYSQAIQNAFQDITTNNGKNMLSNAIAALDGNGATRTDLGMKMAQQILDKNVKKDDAGRKKLVIMFTDGTPTNKNTFDTDVADSAISYSKTIKDDNINVYTIGIFDGADPTSLNSNENKFMNYVSTNFLNAFSMKNPGTRSNTGYYKKASNAAELSSVFESISHDETTSSTTVTLNSESVLKDVISDKFELPEGTTPDKINAYTVQSQSVDSYGNITWGTQQTKIPSENISISGKQVNVKGFDYGKEYVTYKHGGKKIVVEILVNGLETGRDMDSNDTDTLKSGIYENANSTTAVKNFVSPKVTIPEYSYVLDYGKKVSIPNSDDSQSKDYNQTTMINSTKAAPTKDLSIDKTYGTFALESNALTYQPKRINWDGFDSIFSFGKKTDNSYEWSKTNVIPANSVYYEDDFASTEEVKDGDTGTKIIYGGTWTIDGKPQNTENQSSENGQYGWESTYVDDTDYTNGTAHKGTTGATATFKFTGTGVDIYSRTDLTTGKVIATLTKDGEAAGSKFMIVDNKSVSGTYYQVPTLFFENLEYGTYEVKIQVLNPIQDGETSRGTYYLDGIRVYNPLGATTDETVKNAYDVAGESNALFKSVRNVLLDANTFDGNEVKDGAVFIDQIGQDDKDGEKTNVIGTYDKLGPKNEVYLAPGQAIALKINTDYSGKAFIGAKSLAGNEVTMKVTDISKSEKTKSVTIKHTSDMYYQVNPTTDGYVVIQNTNNTGNAVLAITKLRLTGVTTGTNDIQIQSSADLMNYVSEFSLLSSAKTDDKGMPIEKDNNDVEIENPNSGDVDEDNIGNNSNSIWDSVLNNIKNWFDRK
ncbi:VWA domain-containing protein [Intestinibacter sp.]